MPKETIGVAERDGAGVVQVTWGRDTQVQLSTARLPTDEACWWTDLDRHAVNKLIATLRRARDQAYGRDE